jgi:hypothetical protein
VRTHQHRLDELDGLEGHVERDGNECVEQNQKGAKQTDPRGRSSVTHIPHTQQPRPLPRLHTHPPTHRHTGTQAHTGTRRALMRWLSVTVDDTDLGVRLCALLQSCVCLRVHLRLRGRQRAPRRAS